MSIVPVPAPSAPRAPLGHNLRREWRTARDDAESAYRAWTAAPFERRSEAYAVYVAASDREAAAGHALMRAAAVN